MKLQGTTARFETEVEKPSSGPISSGVINICEQEWEGFISKISIFSEGARDFITPTNPLYGGRLSMRLGEDFSEPTEVEELGDELKKSPRRKSNLDRREGDHTRTARAQLKSENEKLVSELRSLRRILATHIESPSDSMTPVYDDRIAAAEMLAVLGAAQVEVLFGLCEEGFLKVESMVEKLGQQSALELVSYLANCRAALVHQDRLILTDFGRELLRWINSLPGKVHRAQ